MYFNVEKCDSVVRDGVKVSVFTVEIEELAEPSNGVGLVTRSGRDETAGRYKWYEVVMNNGVPEMVERHSAYSFDKSFTAEQVEEQLRKTIPTAVVETCETYDGKVVGVPVGLFMKLGVPVERPISQKKGQVCENA